MIYFDANASSQLRPEARAAIDSVVGDVCLNASSVHAAGRSARAKIRRARKQIANALGSSLQEMELIFTSGGTESCQLMLYGLLGGMEAIVKAPGHIVTTAVEHAAMLEAMHYLQSLGWEVDYVAVDQFGRVSPDTFLANLRKDTALVSCMLANNETGCLHDVSGLAQAARQEGFQGLFVSDAIQAFGKTKLEVKNLFGAGVDALALSGHKIGAPPGVGALLLNKAEERCLRLTPIFLGGAQENRFRAGTENLMGICGFGAAAEAVNRSMDSRHSQMSAMREKLWGEISSGLEGLHRLTPSATESIANTLLVAVEDCRGDDLVVSMDLLGVAVSSGAACSSGKQGRSAVAESLPIADTLREGFVRFSLDWDASEEKVSIVASHFVDAVRRMRAANKLEESAGGLHGA